MTSAARKKLCCFVTESKISHKKNDIYVSPIQSRNSVYHNAKHPQTPIQKVTP